MAEVVLLLGPLYHLTDANDRARALREAARVLKPGGRLFAAAISRCGSALDGLARDLFSDPAFAAIVELDLRDGQHRNPTAKLDFFTTAYFHRPQDLLTEVLSAGFPEAEVIGIEGPGWILPDINERLADPRRRADLLRVARRLESESSVQASSAHLLAVARKAASKPGLVLRQFQFPLQAPMQPLAESSRQLKYAIVRHEHHHVAGRVQHRRADLARLQMSVDLRAHCRVKLAVNVTRDMFPDVFAVDPHLPHPNNPLLFGAKPFSFGARSRCSRARARCSLTLTAPSVTPSAVAVSRTSISSMSLSNTTLR